MSWEPLEILKKRILKKAKALIKRGSVSSMLKAKHFSEQMEPFTTSKNHHCCPFVNPKAKMSLKIIHKRKGSHTKAKKKLQYY